LYININAGLSEIHIRIGMKLDYYTHFEYTSAQIESLQAHLDITKRGWIALLAGKREITVSELLKLADWFKTSVSNVLLANF
jgi:plasmid maintenance system antidote protein VapI